MRMIVCLSALVCLAAGLANDGVLQGAVAQTSSAAEAAQLRPLELQYFDQSFDSEPVISRVERFEKLVFGQTHQGSDSARFSRIVSVLDPKSYLPPGDQADNGKVPARPSQAPAQNGSRRLAMKGTTPDPSSDSNPVPDVGDFGSTTRSAPPLAEGANSDDDNGESTDYPHVTALEKEIIGQTYVGQPVTSRLSRLELKAFGKETQSDDLSSRTDALEEYAEKRLHKKPFGVNPEMEQEGTTITVPSQPPHLERHESPEIHDDTPPAPTAPMLTRVGWCEVHVFGHTFPNMHLMQRLRQLNDLLYPSDVKHTGMQLLDRLDAIVDGVVRRQSSSTQSPTSAE